MSEKKIRNRVAVVIVKDSKILLVQHEKYDRRYWLLPGGGVEFGETLNDAGIRELKEETGYDIEMGELLFLSETIPPDHHRHVINYYFSAILKGGELQVEDSPVLKDVQWIDVDDLPHLVMYPSTGREIREWIKTGITPQLSLGNKWD